MTRHAPRIALLLSTLLLAAYGSPPFDRMDLEMDLF